MEKGGERGEKERLKKSSESKEENVKRVEEWGE